MRGGGDAPSRLQLAVAVGAVAFSIWMAGSDAIRDGMILILVGVPVYAVARGRATASPPQG